MGSSRKGLAKPVGCSIKACVSLSEKRTLRSYVLSKHWLPFLLGSETLRMLIVLKSVSLCLTQYFPNLFDIWQFFSINTFIFLKYILGKAEIQLTPQ